MHKAIGLFTALSLSLMSVSAFAQDTQLEWSETLNLPKGLNMPSGVSADLIGIQLGDSYAEARAKLEALLPAQEAKPEEKPASQSLGASILSKQIESMDAGMERAEGPKIRETETTFRLQAPGMNTIISASHISLLELDRTIETASAVKVPETIMVKFSAPSSGHQVIGVYRAIRYRHAERDQPLITELEGSVSTKFAATPRRYSNVWLYQFNDGVAVNQPDLPQNHCRIQYSGGDNEASVPYINQNGDCDVVLTVEMGHGISPDHVGNVIFTLSDNERAKQNYTADYAFFRSYIENLQRNSGAAPKL